MVVASHSSVRGDPVDGTQSPQSPVIRCRPSVAGHRSLADRVSPAVAAASPNPLRRPTVNGTASGKTQFSMHFGRTLTEVRYYISTKVSGRPPVTVYIRRK